MCSGIRTTLFWVKVLLILLFFAVMLWRTALDSFSEADALKRINAAYRPIHQRLDAQIKRSK